MAKLILKFNAAILKEYEIQKSSMTIGRRSDNDIIIDNPAVSSHHCKIIMMGMINSATLHLHQNYTFVVKIFRLSNLAKSYFLYIMTFNDCK